MRLRIAMSLIAAAMLALAAGAGCQQPWQHLQSPTAAEVAARWKTPPPEYGPEPYYGLNGSVSIEQVQRDLDTLHNLGFQAVTVQAGFNMPFAYLSPEYFAFFRKFVEEAKQRNMRVWIVDDAGYPSGFAGGKFTSEKPELRMQALVVEQKILVAGGQTSAPGLKSGRSERGCSGLERRGNAAAAAWRYSQLDGACRQLDGAAGGSRIQHLAHTVGYESEARKRYGAVARRLSEPGGNAAVPGIYA